MFYSLIVLIEHTRKFKVLKKSSRTEELTSIPSTIKNSFRDISCPRIGVGAVSAMYIGAACIA